MAMRSNAAPLTCEVGDKVRAVAAAAATSTVSVAVNSAWGAGAAATRLAKAREARTPGCMMTVLEADKGVTMVGREEPGQIVVAKQLEAKERR